MRKIAIKVMLALAIASTACSSCIYLSRPKQAAEIWSHSTVYYGYPKTSQASTDTNNERLYVAGSTSASLQCLSHTGARRFSATVPLDIGGIYCESNLLLVIDSHSFCVSRDNFQSSQIIRREYVSGYACVLHNGNGLFVSSATDSKICHYTFHEDVLRLSYELDIHKLGVPSEQIARRGEVCIIGVDASDSRVFFVYNTVLYALDIATREIAVKIRMNPDAARGTEMEYRSVSPDSKRLAMLLGKNIVVVDLVDFQILSSFPLYSSAGAVDFDSSGDYLLVAYRTPSISLPFANSGGNISRYDYSGKLHQTWSTKYRSIWCIFHNSDGCFVVADSSIARLKLE